MKNRKVKAIIGGIAAMGLVVVLTSCTSSVTSDQAQLDSQKISEDVAKAAAKAVPYPLSQMESGGFTERHELTENLLRQNNPTAVKYVTLLTQQGQVITQYSIQGMVFDPNSQLTNTQNLESGYNTNNGSTGYSYEGVVDSVGDNGTWGPEAGNAAFFTTSGVEIVVPIGLLWIESDAPLGLTSTPILSFNENETPSASYGNGVKVAGK